MNPMKYLHFIMAVPLLVGIQSCPNKNNDTKKIFACPNEPTIKLENLEEIKLTSAIKSVDGTVGNGRSIGYKFIGKKDQRITYQLEPSNTCIWLYDPNNKIMNTPILPQDGTYILQIASAEGSRTFQLELSINNVDKTPASPPISIQPIPTVDRPSAVEAVKNHYQLINDNNIDDSWKDLSDSFKGSNLTKGEEEYKKWWNQVKTINVNSITPIRQDRDRAIVKVGLTYTLDTGRVVDDTRNKIYLIWDDSNQKWLINDKR
jgi:hypothetical protein